MISVVKDPHAPDLKADKRHVLTSYVLGEDFTGPNTLAIIISPGYSLFCEYF